MVVLSIFGVLVVVFIASPYSYHDRVFPKKLSQQGRYTLEKHFPFYRSLKPGKKVRFESRVARFIKEKDFQTRGEIVFDEEKMILIAASAIKITFGLRHYLLSEFDTILLYPDQYYSPFTDSHNLGETNIGMGMIVFSWKAFEEGHADPNDGLNVALHEFAHAIVLQMMKNGAQNNLFEEGYKNWQFLIAYPGVREAIESSGFFRDYAFVNDMEFFAVSMEAFFEQGDEMRSQWPDIYNCFVNMLNFDPVLMKQKNNINS